MRAKKARCHCGGVILADLTGANAIIYEEPDGSLTLGKIEMFGEVDSRYCATCGKEYIIGADGKLEPI